VLLAGVVNIKVLHGPVAMNVATTTHAFGYQCTCYRTTAFSYPYACSIMNHIFLCVLQGDTQNDMKCAMAFNVYCQDGVFQKLTRLQQNDGMFPKILFDVSIPPSGGGKLRAKTRDLCCNLFALEPPSVATT
jgi:hypothetical protein